MITLIVIPVAIVSFVIGVIIVMIVVSNILSKK